MKKTSFILSLILILSYQIGFAQWELLAELPKSSSIIDITFGQGDKVYALTSGRTIVYSNDNGNTWESFVDTPFYMNITQIKASKTSNRVFANTSSCCGIAYTDNLGANWHWDNIATDPVSGFGLAPRRIDVFGTKVAAVVSRVILPIGVVIELYVSTLNGVSGSSVLKNTVSTDSGNGAKGVFLLNNDLVFITFTSQIENFSAISKSNDGGTTFTDIPFFNGKKIEDMHITDAQIIY